MKKFIQSALGFCLVLAISFSFAGCKVNTDFLKIKNVLEEEGYVESSNPESQEAAFRAHTAAQIKGVHIWLKDTVVFPADEWHCIFIIEFNSLEDMKTFYLDGTYASNMISGRYPELDKEQLYGISAQSLYNKLAEKGHARGNLLFLHSPNNDMADKLMKAIDERSLL